MPSDEELARRLVENDEAALGELLRRWERPLSHFLHRRTGGRDVEDLYQETWLRVVRNVDRFDARRRFSTWLFQIAVNLCRDWGRRRPPEPGAVAERGGRGELDRAEAGLDAARLLASLPDAQREVLILRFYHDLSEREVAAILSIPVGTVKSRLHNALAKLAATLEGEGEAAESGR